MGNKEGGIVGSVGYKTKALHCEETLFTKSRLQCLFTAGEPQETHVAHGLGPRWEHTCTSVCACMQRGVEGEGEGEGEGRNRHTDRQTKTHAWTNANLNVHAYQHTSGELPHMQAHLCMQTNAPLCPTDSSSTPIRQTPNPKPSTQPPTPTSPNTNRTLIPASSRAGSAGGPQATAATAVGVRWCGLGAC